MSKNYKLSITKKKCLFFLVMLSIQFVFAQSENIKEADSLYLLGDYSKAIKAYKLCSSSKSYSKMADVYTALGSYDKALEYYSKALILDSSTLLKYKYAKLLSKTGNYNQALSFFQELVSYDKTNSNYFYELGILFEHQKDTNAIYGFRKAFQLDNTHQKAVYKIARIHLVGRNYDSVSYYVDIGLNSYGNNKKLIAIQAQSYYLNNDYKNAIYWYKKLLNLGESKSFIHENLRDCYRSTNQLKKAIEQGVLALSFEPNDVKNLYVLGLLYEQIEEYHKSEKHIKKAVLNMDNPLDEEYLKLGYIQQKQKKYKETIYNLNKAINENPQSTEAHFYLVYTKDKYYKDSQIKIKLYRKFMKRFPNSRFDDIVKSRLKELQKETFFGKSVP